MTQNCFPSTPFYWAEAVVKWVEKVDRAGNIGLGHSERDNKGRVVDVEVVSEDGGGADDHDEVVVLEDVDCCWTRSGLCYHSIRLWRSSRS